MLDAQLFEAVRADLTGAVTAFQSENYGRLMAHDTATGVDPNGVKTIASADRVVKSRALKAAAEYIGGLKGPGNEAKRLDILEQISASAEDLDPEDALEVIVACTKAAEPISGKAWGAKKLERRIPKSEAAIADTSAVAIATVTEYALLKPDAPARSILLQFRQKILSSKKKGGKELAAEIAVAFSRLGFFEDAESTLALITDPMKKAHATLDVALQAVKLH
jgi:hypothetical protein